MFGHCWHPARDYPLGYGDQEVQEVFCHDTGAHVTELRLQPLQRVLPRPGDGQSGVYMNAISADLGETIGNIIAESYKSMV